MSAVLLLHTVSLTGQAAVGITATQNAVYQAIRQVCSIGVPLFLMISGALFLNPNRELSLRRLLGKYVLRLLLVILLFSTLYAMMEIFVENHLSFSFSMIGQAVMRMLSGDSWDAMWYLYMLPGVYLTIPLMRCFTRYAELTSYRYLLAVLLIFQCILPFIKTLTGFTLGFTFPITSIYLFYFLIGDYLHRFVPSSKVAVGAVCCLCLSIVAGVCKPFCFPQLPIDYNMPLTLLSATSLFCLVGRKNTVPAFFTKLRPLCFSVYLIHPLLLNIAYKLLGLSPLCLGGYVLIPVFFSILWLLFFGCAWIMVRIPLLNKIL